MGITSGTGETTFSPDQTCTRGQIVTFLHRAYSHGYDYETPTLPGFIIYGDYTLSTDEYDLKLSIQESHVTAGMDFELRVRWKTENKDQGWPEEEGWLSYSGLSMFRVNYLDVRYYEDIVVLIGRDDIGRFVEGVYVKDGHTELEWAKEIFGHLGSARNNN